ncbi:MAG: GNAT family N-acetyltransferase [Candidatus Eremiobacteraeota bacterium]|nr:GNAT family N-acetyltransferase [Candidatus Eremiobacteraeota bacterium]
MVEVREIGADDWRLFRRLRLDALAKAPYAFGATLADWSGERDAEARWRARLSTVPFNVVAYLDHRPAGIASGLPGEEDGTTELISMWVAPFARGRGVADALVGAVVRWSRERRATKLFLNVVEDNARARSVYRRLGFVDTGARCPNELGLVEQQMVLTL